MAGGRIINAIDVPAGEKRKTPRKTTKKCKVCGKALSMYNSNKYCFVHIMRGYELERDIADNKKYFSYQKHIKKMKERKKRDKDISDNNNSPKLSRKRRVRT